MVPKVSGGCRFSVALFLKRDPRFVWRTLMCYIAKGSFCHLRAVVSIICGQVCVRLAEQLPAPASVLALDTAPCK